jgi:DNA-binding MarR family transcriptional regulator
MVDALETTGLVVRLADPDDRRSVLVAPTAQGRTLLARLEAARRHSAEGIFGQLDPARRDVLAALLGELCEQGGCVSCCTPHGAHHRHAGGHR